MHGCKELKYHLAIANYRACLMRQLLRHVCSAGQYMCTKQAFVILYRTVLRNENEAVKRINVLNNTICIYWETVKQFKTSCDIEYFGRYGKNLESV